MPKSTKRSKKPKGKHTKPNIWDQFRNPPLIRGGAVLDPGVNFFVRSLEMMGMRTHFSCEGHPNGFYITFSARYSKALRIREAGYFSIEIERQNYWSMRINTDDNERGHVDGLRWAAEAWAKRFGIPKESS